MLCEVLHERCRLSHLRSPQPAYSVVGFPVGIWGGQPEVNGAGQVQLLPAASPEVWSAAVHSAYFDYPHPVGQRSGNMHRRGLAIVAVPGHGGRQSSGGVDHNQVAGRKQGGQVKEAAMLDLAGAGHQGAPAPFFSVMPRACNFNLTSSQGMLRVPWTTKTF